MTGVRANEISRQLAGPAGRRDAGLRRRIHDSTLDGEPVVGPLVGQGIKLEPLSVATTTWGQWRAEHPETKVLSLDTGHRRDYGEGVAYHDYFATDKLMFEVPTLDTRLKNKDEVLAIRLDDRTDERLAISAAFLATHRIYHDRLGETEFVVLTDDTGANRAYESKGVKFVEELSRAELLNARLDQRQQLVGIFGLKSKLKLSRPGRLKQRSVEA